jgi:hypothetical protein
MIYLISAMTVLTALGWLLRRIYRASKLFVVWLESILRRFFPYEW